MKATQQDEILVRRATMAGFEGVSGVFSEDNHFHANLLPQVFRVLEPIMTREWFGKVLTNPDKALFVAARKGEIVGVQLLSVKTNPDDPIFKEHRYAYVDELAVAKEYRRQGVGRLLMEKARQWGIEQGMDEVQLDVWEVNQGALNFYKKMGYRTVRRRLKYRIASAP